RPAVPPHPEAERALSLLEAVASGDRDAVRALARLLRRLLPADPRADALATLLPAVAVGPAVRRFVRLVLEVLARGGIVPAGSHLDNIPSARALRAGGRATLDSRAAAGDDGCGLGGPAVSRQPHVLVAPRLPELYRAVLAHAGLAPPTGPGR